jgi:Cu+-exporting ATPase
MQASTTIDLPVLGMTCAACVRRVEKAVAAVPGVVKAEVNLPLSRARIELDPARASANVAAAAIRDAGYEVPADVLEASATGGARLEAIERAQAGEVRALRRDAVIALVLTVPLVAIAMMHGMIDPTASVIVQAVLGTIVVLGPGLRYFRGGLAAVRHGSPDMNTLIALGAGAAWLSSAVAAARWLGGPRMHAPDIYFEAGAAIVAFVMIGKVIESRARARLGDAVRGLVSLAPARAHLDDSDVDAAALVPGDVVVVRPGERVPADGTIVEGSSALDESMLTGESLPVDRGEGSPVYAGTLNHQGALRVRVARAGADTALARIARAVEDAQGTKAPIARLADRVSAYFVPAVLAIAAVTGIAWWLVGGVAFDVALARTIAVLVIACPCALGLATPAAVAVGTARGAQLGILFGGGDALERASHISVACLDKTGTLTRGQPALTSLEGGDEVLRLAASVEQSSEHPIARAVVAAALARGLSLEPATDVTVEPGHGLRAHLSGQTIHVGTPSYVAPFLLSQPSKGVKGERELGSWVVVDGVMKGGFTVADPAAPEAKQAVSKLRELGIEPVMITGDREAAARDVAAEIGIERVHAGVRPTGKAAIVEAERKGGRRVAMVGDGINDAPALAAADLGVAMGSGTDVAAAAADVTLMRGIEGLPTALALARATMHVIRRNLVAAFAYNVVCIPIAAAGLLSPVVASAAMSLSSISVLLSSLRLRRFMR